MDPYMSSLSTAAGTIPLGPGRNPGHVSQKITSPEQEMQRQLEEFNRSVTIIFWYKSNTEPIRLPQMISTFPYFQLSHLGSLTSDLGLSPDSYLDAFNPHSGQWEQHKITTVRVVEPQQRLLYRVRKSLMEGLSEDECRSLREEVALQQRKSLQLEPVQPLPPDPSPRLSAKAPSSGPKRSLSGVDTSTKASLKRSAPEPAESANSSKIHISEGYYMTHNDMTNNGPAAGTSTTPAPPSFVSNSVNGNIEPQQETAYIYQNQPTYYNQAPPSTSSLPLPHYLTSPPSSAPPIPYHPHPPLKRWPNDYTVSELSAGFNDMDSLIQQSPSGANMTQRVAFERVFGSRYVKSTVCRHRAVWRKAHPSIREQFEALGMDERGIWGEFVRRVEGRPPGKSSGNAVDMTMQPPTPMMYHSPPSHPNTSVSMIGTMNGQDMSRQTIPQRSEGEGSLNEPVMSSLQQQGASSNNLTMQAGMNVYDTSLNRLPGGTRV